MYKITAILIFIVFCSCDQKNEIQNITKQNYKGVFGLRDVNKLQKVNAEYTRIIVWDSHLEALYNQVDTGTSLKSSLEYQQIKSIYDAGIKVILTLRWPDQDSSDPKLYDRVPEGQDRVDALNLLTRFLDDFGPLIEVYSVQNEVGGLGPGTYQEEDMQSGNNGIPAIEWWKDIVAKINNEKENNPDLAHLKISSPTAVLLKKIAFDAIGLPQTNIDFFYQTINFGNDYCDFIDFHFNTYSLSEYETVLNFLNPLVIKPMIATEWSEVGSANNYISEQISLELRNFATSVNYNIPSNLRTNEDLIEYLYNNPTNIELWELMIEESDYQTGFMIQSSDLLFSSGFQILCWNSGFQEGLPAFDLRSFYASKTVSSQINELTNFTDEFKNL